MIIIIATFFLRILIAQGIIPQETIINNQEKQIVMKNKAKHTHKLIENGVISGYKIIEDGFVSGYKKIEDGVVSKYNKVEDRFVDKHLRRENETISEAKARLKRENRQ